MPKAFAIFFFLMLGIIACVFIAVLSAIVRQSSRNRAVQRANAASPQLNRPARVVSKRAGVTGNENSTRTSYFATFEFPGGAREEFPLEGQQYGLLSEGDTGTLTSQGTWFQSFTRTGPLGSGGTIQDRSGF